MLRLHSAIRQAQVSRSWIGWVLVLAGLLTVAPYAASGQEADVTTLIDRGQKAGANVERMRTVSRRAQQAGLTSDATAALLRPAVELAEQDLPTGPLLNKTLEGFSKQVPPARLRPVIQQLQTYTEQAGQVVSRWAQRPDVRSLTGDAEPPERGGAARSRLVRAIAEAQMQDLQLEHIDQFLSELPSAVERRPVPLSEVATAVSVLPDLPGSKGSPKAARQLLTAALGAGYSPESLRQLPAALRSARRASQRPSDALVKGAAQAIARGTPAADVLGGLSQGSPPGIASPGGRGNGPPGKGPGSGKPPGQEGNPPKGPPENPPGGGPPENPPGGGSAL